MLPKIFKVYIVYIGCYLLKIKFYLCSFFLDNLILYIVYLFTSVKMFLINITWKLFSSSIQKIVCLYDHLSLSLCRFWCFSLAFFHSFKIIIVSYCSISTRAHFKFTGNQIFMFINLLQHLGIDKASDVLPPWRLHLIVGSA